jgi:hypothetical protein
MEPFKRCFEKWAPQKGKHISLFSAISFPLFSFSNFISGGISFSQTYLGAGVYQVTYTPSVSGTFTISVQLNGFAPVVNNPFIVNVESTRMLPFYPLPSILDFFISLSVPS